MTVWHVPLQPMRIRWPNGRTILIKLATFSRVRMRCGCTPATMHIGSRLMFGLNVKFETIIFLAFFSERWLWFVMTMHYCCFFSLSICIIYSHGIFAVCTASYFQISNEPAYPSYIVWVWRRNHFIFLHSTQGHISHGMRTINMAIMEHGSSPLGLHGL
jgi:hypothetical protein